MAYPYGSSASNNAYGDYNKQPYPPYQPSRQQSHVTETEFDPYSAGNSRNKLNDESGLRYRDDRRANESVDFDAAGREKVIAREISGSQFSPTRSGFPQNKESFSSWRKNHKEDGAWKRGSAVGCICRYFFCSLLITLFLLFSIILTIATYVRPPDVLIGAVALDTDAPTGAIERTANSITIHLKVPITVDNPNFFDAGFSKVTATAFYPLSGQTDTVIGGGNMTDVVFKSNSEKTINFPLNFAYSNDIDPTGAVLQDIASRCGVGGGQKRDLPIKYQIKVDIKILIPTISPVFSGSANFACPLSASDFQTLGGGLLNGAG